MLSCKLVYACLIESFKKILELGNDRVEYLILLGFRESGNEELTQCQAFQVLQYHS